MIHVVFSEPIDAAWGEWRALCCRASSALVKARESGQIAVVDAQLYKGQKHVYVGLGGSFHGKCAYCESLIGADQPGDIDHFRPKNRITADSDTVMATSGNEAHPGYYWLAYDWRNLLPACEDCNRPSKAKTAGVRIGKWDEFPVRGFRAERPGDENKEEPLLLNPAVVDPAIHLDVADDGMMIPLTDEGNKSIEVFGLNVREALLKSRRIAFDDGKTAVEGALVAAVHGNNDAVKRHLDALEGFQRGARPYSVAGRAGVAKSRSSLPKDLIATVLG